MSDKKFRITLVIVAWALVVSGCGSPSEHHEAAMASTVTIENQWASSADMGMAAIFGTLANAGHHDARIVSGDSPVAGRVEVHEVVSDATGNKAMRPKAGGLTIPAGGTLELVPGGDHLMLMELKQPLLAGADVELAIEFTDGSTMPITAQVRDFAGADEEYAPGGPAPAAPHHDHG